MQRQHTQPIVWGELVDLLFDGGEDEFYALERASGLLGQDGREVAHLLAAGFGGLASQMDDEDRGHADDTSDGQAAEQDHLAAHGEMPPEAGRSLAWTSNGWAYGHVSLNCALR